MEDIIETNDLLSFSQGSYENYICLFCCFYIFQITQDEKIKTECISICFYHKKGIVLAVNARVLEKNPHPFDSILVKYSQMQLLVWTGTGEPPISQSKISKIQRHFEANGCIEQIGFDCKV